MKMREHVAIRVTVRAVPRMAPGEAEHFAAEVKGLSLHGEPAEARMAYGATRERAYGQAVAMALREMAAVAELTTSNDELPDRMLIELRRDRSHG